MSLTRKLIVTAALAAMPFATLAQDAASIVDRNGDQQRRIEQGLRTGDLSVQEAARLEREAARVNQIESRALRDGTLTDAERARIDRAQDHLGRDIARERHDAERGDPNSPSSRRMQADVQRNIYQQERIEQGLRSGQLTNREAARLEHGQARIYGMEARAAADGHVSGHEQRRIQQAENVQSRRIYQERHDRQTRHDDVRRDQRFRHGGDQHTVAGHRHEGGFRSNAQARPIQHQTYAQAGRRHAR
jgi:hypothetical protein